MISPVTVTILPGTGLPLTAAPTEVAVHGSLGFSPSVPMGLSHPPSGTISGWSMAEEDFLPSGFFSSAAGRVKARAVRVNDAKSVFRYIGSPRFKDYDRKDYSTRKIGQEKMLWE